MGERPGLLNTCAIIGSHTKAPPWGERAAGCIIPRGGHSNAGSHDPSAGHARSNVVQLVVDSLVGSAGLQRLHAARFSLVTRVQTRGRRDGLVPDERTARLQRLTASSATHSLVFARDIDDDVDLCPDTPQVRVLSYRTTHASQSLLIDSKSLKYTRLLNYCPPVVSHSRNTSVHKSLSMSRRGHTDTQTHNTM